MLIPDKKKYLSYAVSTALIFLIAAYCLALGVHDELISGVMQAKRYSCSLHSEFWCYSFGVIVKFAGILFCVLHAYILARDVFKGHLGPVESSRFIDFFRSKELVVKGWFVNPLILIIAGFCLII